MKVEWHAFPGHSVQNLARQLSSWPMNSIDWLYPVVIPLSGIYPLNLSRSRVWLPAMYSIVTFLCSVLCPVISRASRWFHNDIISMQLCALLLTHFCVCFDDVTETWNTSMWLVYTTWLDIVCRWYQNSFHTWSFSTWPSATVYAVHFYSHDAMHKCSWYWRSQIVHPSVCHDPVLCWNGLTYHWNSFTI